MAFSSVQNVRGESRSPVAFRFPGACLACTPLNRAHHRNGGKKLIERRRNRVKGHYLSSIAAVWKQRYLIRGHLHKCKSNVTDVLTGGLALVHGKQDGS